MRLLCFDNNDNIYISLFQKLFEGFPPLNGYVSNTLEPDSVIIGLQCEKYVK